MIAIAVKSTRYQTRSSGGLRVGLPVRPPPPWIKISLISWSFSENVQMYWVGATPPPPKALALPTTTSPGVTEYSDPPTPVKSWHHPDFTEKNGPPHIDEISLF